jgi:iron complex outermembrane recepter protein
VPTACDDGLAIEFNAGDINVTKRASQQDQSLFRLSPVAAGAAVLLMAMGSAQAQTTPSTQPAAEKDKDAVQTITVTGIRRGIENAINVKKNSDSIVEVVSAEDIGKLPDNSIAESLARLPGLVAQRVNGRAQEIQIRGLAGQFATTLLNGREQVSTGDNRSAEFDQYPSELQSAVVVYKTPDAALIGQGLSGTVDLQTVRPLSFSGRTIALSLRGEKNSLGKLNANGAGDTGHRLSASYIDQFADKTLGVALGYARLNSPNQNEYYRNWGYPTGSGPGADGNTYNNVRLPGGVQVRAESAEQTRDGLMGVVQWKPAKNFESLLDVYHSKFKRVALQRGFEAGLAWSGAQIENAVVSGASPTAVPNVFEGGVLTGARYVGVKPVLRDDLNDRDDKLTAFGWNNKFSFDGWSLTGDVSWSKADRKESILELYAGTVPGSANATDTFDVTLPVGGGVPSIRAGLNYADPSIIRLVDSGGWNQAGYIKTPKVEDELKALKLSAKRDMDLGPISRIDFGINLNEREKSRTVDEWFLDLKSSPTTVPANLLVTPTSLAFVGIPATLSYDTRAAYNQFYNLRANLGNRDIINKNWVVNEKLTTGFLKADLDTEVMGFGLRGNVGLQTIYTKQESTATNITASSSVTAGTSYADVLPSMNLALSLPSDQTVRVAVARQIARPRMDDLRATRSYSVSLTEGPAPVWTGDGGNPELKPWKADAFDISYEKYFGSKAYISLAYYHKDLKSYIYKQKVDRDFTQLFPGITPPTGSPTPPSNIGKFEQPANGKGGTLKGIEFAVSMPLSQLAPALDGFGVQFTYTGTDSKIQPFGPGDTRPLPGLSKSQSNLTGYYEKFGFSARASARKRGSFVGEITGFGADRSFEYVKGETIIDLQVGYEIQSGPAKGLSLLFQVNNASNEPYVEYYDNDPTKTRQYTTYGRTYLLGANYKF